MLRHEIVLNPSLWEAAVVRVGRLEGTWPRDGWRELSHPDGVRGRFRVALTRDSLELAGEIREPRGWEKRWGCQHPEWYYRDHVVLLVDPGHDHTTRRMVAVLRDGQVCNEDAWHLDGEERADVFRSELKMPPLQARVQVSETGRGWRVLVRVPRRRLAGLGGRLALRTPLGLQLRMGVGGAVLKPAVCWPPADPQWGDGPFAFGDVVERGAGLTVTGMDFGKPVWQTGDVTSRLKLGGRVRRKGMTGTCSVTITGTDGGCETTVHAWRAAGRDVQMTVPIGYPFASKWAPDCLRIARVGVAMLGADGRLLWHASYPFGFDAGIIVREPFGLMGRGVAGRRRPNPDDPAFVDRYRAWLLRRLPDWRWTTTRQGAASDFYLKAGRREDDVDLMRPDVMAVLARLVHRKFSNWQDGLSAASMLLHHPCLTVHSSVWNRLAGIADAPTVLRLGGCFCSETGRLAALLAEALGPLYGVKLKGFTLGLRGHISGLVETPVGDVLVDPMLGVCYPALDNRRLATLQEMQADPRIAARMWALPRSKEGAAFFGGAQAPIKRELAEASLVYPPISNRNKAKGNP